MKREIDPTAIDFHSGPCGHRPGWEVIRLIYNPDRQDHRHQIEAALIALAKARDEDARIPSASELREFAQRYMPSFVIDISDALVDLPPLFTETPTCQECGKRPSTIAANWSGEGRTTSMDLCAECAPIVRERYDREHYPQLFRGRIS